MHHRFIRYTNGGPQRAAGLSPRAQLGQAGALLVLAFTVMEPASAFGLAWWQRAGFYAAHVAPAMALAWWASGFLFQRPALRRWPAWALLALAGAAAGLVLAPWSVVLEQALGVVDLEEPGAPPLPPTAAAWRTEVAGELLQVVPRTAVFWVAMNLWVLWRASPPPSGSAGPREARPANPEPEPAPSPTWVAAPTAPVMPAAAIAPPPTAQAPGDAPALFDRLPARLGRDVVRLEAQQHYLRVVTTRGEQLLLHGLSPAVDEMARRGVAGMQIHRSSWVAWAHVERLDLRPGSPAAVLRDGTRLPIGRRRIREVAAAWHQWPGVPGPRAGAAPGEASGRSPGDGSDGRPAG